MITPEERQKLKEYNSVERNDYGFRVGNRVFFDNPQDTRTRVQGIITGMNNGKTVVKDETGSYEVPNWSVALVPPNLYHEGPQGPEYEEKWAGIFDIISRS